MRDHRAYQTRGSAETTKSASRTRGLTWIEKDQRRETILSYGCGNLEGHTNFILEMFQENVWDLAHKFRHQTSARCASISWAFSAAHQSWKAVEFRVNQVNY